MVSSISVCSVLKKKPTFIIKKKYLKKIIFHTWVVYNWCSVKLDNLFQLTHIHLNLFFFFFVFFSERTFLFITFFKMEIIRQSGKACLLCLIITSTLGSNKIFCDFSVMKGYDICKKGCKGGKSRIFPLFFCLDIIIHLTRTHNQDYLSKHIKKSQVHCYRCKIQH